VLVIVLGIGAAAWTTRGFLLRGLAQRWAVSDPLVQADAIFVLGGGDETRPFAAATLYEDNLAKEILVSNARHRGPVEKLGIRPAEAELDRQILLKLGVPPEAITVIGSNLSSTYEESLALAEWAKKTGAKRIIIPTEIFPSRRVRWIFNRQLQPIGVTPIVVAYPNQNYTIDNWWHVHDGIIDFQNEVLKDVYYHLRY
jgi:uncharacterized SAM-binding protein YcdF (DUF218 family)